MAFDASPEKKLNSAQQKRQLNGLITMSLFFVLSAYFFYFNSDKTEPVTYGFVIGNEIVLLNEWVVDSKRAVEIFVIQQNLQNLLTMLMQLQPWQILRHGFLMTYLMMVI